MEQIWSVAEEAMEREGLDPSAVCGLASIDLKSGEPGLCSLAEKLGVPFFTYTGEELARRTRGVYGVRVRETGHGRGKRL